MRKTAAASALLVAALGFAAGATGAAQADQNEAVNFTATNTEKSTIIKTDAGSLTNENGVFKIKAANGAVLGGTELSFRVDDFVFPIAAEISDHTATLTPELEIDKAVYQPVALPFDDTAPWKTPYDREQAAWGRMRDTIATGAAIGTLTGGLGGGAVGCIIGGVVGAGAAAAAIVGLFGPIVPAAVLGCIGGMAAIGFLGTLAGQLLITAPVAILAAVQYFTTINQPFTPAK
ncbi:hypothetical protein [Nocardia sp. NBC_01327]|uniref:hypothetical protein n=1 Tax=Nocardia sp. NBC_01327 TaxID=2903593 RepID=UPI002E15F081|nr:hypothetical protein OG326_27710 [Nocardia sp. NBC_01327]